ncbi:hypothetical protein [Bradyrhizobium sp. USDA 10063]
MPDLLANSADACLWVEQIKQRHSATAIFGKVVGSVIWSDATGPDGELLVPIDPVYIVDKINGDGLRLLKGHDPGFPLGKVLAAADFTSSSGERFVAAVLGLYDGKRLSFRDLEVDTAPAPSSPAFLPAINNDCWINFAVDPREVDSQWIDDVLRTAPMPVKRIPLSNNAAESTTELIVIGVLFITLIFKPFVTTIATEAGKEVYVGVRNWLRMFLSKLSERKKPTVEIQSFHDDCQISFMFRGTGVKRHYDAHDALPDAAVQAQHLVKNMKWRGFHPKLIVYEFHSEDDKWFPSYAELHDGRLITDNRALIAIEQLPSGLSLGISLGGEKPRLPCGK